jgi:hypothetical protein
MRQSIVVDAALEKDTLLESAVFFAATLLRFSDTFFSVWGIVNLRADTEYLHATWRE